MIVDRCFVRQGHVHRFVVAAEHRGWQVREEEDDVVLRKTHRHDWHRVERDLSLFGLTATLLKRTGWTESADATINRSVA